VEDWAEIHRLFHREGRPKAAIARQLEMSRNTVERLLSLPAPPRYVRPSTGSRLDPFVEHIATMLVGSPSYIETGRREAQRSEDRVGEDARTRTEAGAADEASPTMTLLARRFLGVVHWRRRVPAPDCQTEPPRGAAMRR